MTATLPDVAARRKEPAEQSAEQQVAAELVRQAREKGLSLTGPDGLLKQLTKTVIEAALQEEITEHLGYEKHDPAGAGTGNIRNGTRGKTVLTEASGEVEIDVPRDRAGTFEPIIVKRRQRRLEGVDQVVLSLYAKGLTTGETSDALRRDLRRFGEQGDHLAGAAHSGAWTRAAVRLLAVLVLRRCACGSSSRTTSPTGRSRAATSSSGTAEAYEDAQGRFGSDARDIAPRNQ